MAGVSTNGETGSYEAPEIERRADIREALIGAISSGNIDNEIN